MSSIKIVRLLLRTLKRRERRFIRVSESRTFERFNAGDKKCEGMEPTYDLRSNAYKEGLVEIKVLEF